MFEFENVFARSWLALRVFQTGRSVGGRGGVLLFFLFGGFAPAGGCVRDAVCNRDAVHGALMLMQIR